MNQPTLFDTTDAGRGAYGYPRLGDDEPRPPHNGKATSRAAAEAAEPKAGTWRAKVLEFIRACGTDGATRDEAVAALAMNPNTLRPRWAELEDAGLIRNSGRTRRNSAGNTTEVYLAREDG